MQRQLAMITGASSGIGEVFARKLAPQYDLLLVARSKDRLAALAQELSSLHGGMVTVVDADLSDASQLERVAERIAAEPKRAGSASYGATKSWVAAFSEGLHIDLRKAKSAVKIQALCPGFTYSGFHDAMGEDRRRIAPAAFWLTAEQVVGDSLAALAHGPVFVIPGWRYKWLAAVVRALPLWLKLKLETPRG